MKSSFLLFLFTPFALACGVDQQPDDEAGIRERQDSEQGEPEQVKKAYFASGCFWCVEHIYEEVEGVEEVISGFAGGSKKDPGYREVASGKTDHAETVKVLYDPEVVDFNTLVDVFYASQDPTTVGQKPDMGRQYRSIIFYHNERERMIAQEAKDSLEASGEYEDPIVTGIEPFEAFYEAGEKHQDYVKKHPDDRYVKTVSDPRFERFKEKMPEVLK